MKQLVFSLVAVVFLNISCQEKYSSSEDEIAVNNIVDEWEKNGATGNRVANAEFFTDNGIRVQGGKIYRGKGFFL